MPKTTIRLIRHASGTHMGDAGVIAGRSPSAQLTREGRSQAHVRGLSWQCEGYQPDFIESSPILRCRMTAEIALRAAGLSALPVTMRDELAEMCQGALEGQPRTAEIQAQMDKQRGSFRAPGVNEEGLPGENFGDGTARCLAYLQSHAQASANSEQDRQVLAFSHRVLLGTGLSYLALRREIGPEGVSADDVRDRYMGTRTSVPIPPCSETSITVWPGDTVDAFQFDINYIGRTEY